MSLGAWVARRQGRGDEEKRTRGTVDRRAADGPETGAEETSHGEQEKEDAQDG